jgi:hypothetical protein
MISYPDLEIEFNHRMGDESQYCGIFRVEQWTHTTKHHVCTIVRMLRKCVNRPLGYVCAFKHAVLFPNRDTIPGNNCL